jgi:uncharacterized membrane protein
MLRFAKFATTIFGMLAVVSVFFPFWATTVGLGNEPSDNGSYAQISAAFLCAVLLVWVFMYVRPNAIAPGYTPAYAMFLGLVFLAIAASEDFEQTPIAGLIFFVLPFPFITLAVASLAVVIFQREQSNPESAGG